MRHVTNAVNPTEADVRRVEEDGTEYLVAPSIVLREKIYEYPEDDTDEILPADAIAESADRWNGSRLTIGHPVSGPAPQIGEFRNPEALNDGEKLRGETWIDASAAERHTDGRAIIRALESEETLSVSPGYDLTDYDETPGRHNGKAYDGVQAELAPDHVAVFPPDSAATARCLPSEGCALPRANASKTPMTDDPQSTDDRETATDAGVDSDTLTQRVRDVLREMFTGEGEVDARANADDTESPAGDGDAGGETDEDTSGDDAATTADAEDQSGDHADATPEREDTVGDGDTPTGGDDTDPDESDPETDSDPDPDDADAAVDADPSDTDPDPTADADPDTEPGDESASAEHESNGAELADPESSATPDPVSTMNDAEKIDFLVEERGLDRENVAHLEGTDCLDDIYTDAKRTLEAEEESEDDQPDADAESESEDDGEGENEDDSGADVTPEAESTETPEAPQSPETPGTDADSSASAESERMNAILSKLDEFNERLERVEEPHRERRENAISDVADHLGISEESVRGMSDDDLYEKAEEARTAEGGQRANAQQSPQAMMGAVQTGVDRANAQDGPDDDEITRLMPGREGYEARNGGDN